MARNQYVPQMGWLIYIISFQLFPFASLRGAQMQTFSSRLFHYPRLKPLDGEVRVLDSCEVITLQSAVELSRRPYGGLGTQRALAQLSGNSWGSCSLKPARQHNSSSQET